MQSQMVIARSLAQDVRTATASPSLECVSLFSLLGIVVSAAMLLTSSAETVAAVTAALI
jgi:hypothetical protein